jgi:hypothetical protein
VLFREPLGYAFLNRLIGVMAAVSVVLVLHLLGETATVERQAALVWFALGIPFLAGAAFMVQTGGVWQAAYVVTLITVATISSGIYYTFEAWAPGTGRPFIVGGVITGAVWLAYLSWLSSHRCR